MTESVPEASIVIVTKNRKDELRQAVQSSIDQDGPIEVIVIDDGSTDGTSEMVRKEFGAVKLYTFDSSKGLIVRRNFGAGIAKAPFVFSLDDDAIFSTRSIVATTIRNFSEDRIGAVAIPFINVNQDAAVHQLSPEPTATYITYTYVGTAHALRREMFLRLGGYTEYLIHQGEEEDFAIRMLDAGYVIRMGTSEAINHFESPKRSLDRMDYYGRRNQIFFAILRVPMPFAAAHMAKMLARGIREILKTRRVKSMTYGMLDGVAGLFTLRGRRKPVHVDTYRTWMRLKKLKKERIDVFF